MKRIETLERDISEIHSLQQDIKVDREYSVPVKISLEQQVNNLLNEKVKLMEVHIENAPEYFKKENRTSSTANYSDAKKPVSFDGLEREYFENLRYKRSNYNQDSAINIDKLQPVDREQDEPEVYEKLETRGIPSLAEKSLARSGGALSEEEKSFIKRREDILKNLPPLEY